MKLNPSKFGLALAIGSGLFFLLCYAIFFIGGNDFSLNVLNILFHGMDFKSIMIESDFNIWKLLLGMFIMFLVGLGVGYSTASIYNSLNRNTKSN